MRAKGQSPLGPHQELAYWTTLCPNPALSMRKVVGLSVSKLKQREEASAGEEGEERSFGKGSSFCSISLGSTPSLPCRPSVTMFPGLLDSQPWTSFSFIFLFQMVRRQLFTQWTTGKFQFSISAKQCPSSKAPTRPLPWGS